MARPDFALETECLSFAFPFRQVLRDVTLSLPFASITTLAGLNGAGKSTLLRCLAGVEPRYTGHVRLFGLDTRKEPMKTRQLAGFLNDSFGFPSGQTVGQFLQYIAGLRGFTGAALKNTLDYTRDILRLSQDMWEMTAATLSGGLRQRVGLAGALVHQPRLVFLDEPVSMLDPPAKREFFNLLDTLRSNKITVLLSMHHLEEMATFSDNFIVLSEGQVIDHSALSVLDADGAAATSARRVYLKITGEAAAYSPLVLRCTGLKTVRCRGSEMVLELRASDADIAALVRLLVLNKMPLVSFRVAAFSLDDLFQRGAVS
ncbi:MAG: ABC transporter ATP-binding protein [Alphaproteobacteria bacterium]|jgi:ABC-2 type transport system ATP-binding protein|nr:ABC transporter ATP-binding protein [Alphaproteobacteria bacterium]